MRKSFLRHFIAGIGAALERQQGVREALLRTLEAARVAGQVASFAQGTDERHALKKFITPNEKPSTPIQAR